MSSNTSNASNASFTVTLLSFGEALVEGTDSKGVEGQTVVSTRSFNEYKKEVVAREAAELSAKASDKFYAPLLEAAAKVDDLIEAAVDTWEDPLAVVVLDEGVQHVEGEAATIFVLDQDGVILRHIEENGGRDLRWIGDTLVATQPAAKAKAKRKR